MTKKRFRSDFQDFMEEVKDIPEVKEYLNSFPVIIGDLVMARRIHLGWSQRQLAEAAGTNQARISQIESGYEGVKMGTIDKVFKALGLSQINPSYVEDAAAEEV